MHQSRLNRKYPWTRLDLSDFDNPRAYAGWYAIMNKLLEQILDRYNEWDIALNEDSFALRQVKEKFGGLRVYASGINVEDLCRAPEETSLHTCMACGSPGAMVVTGTWFHVVCSKHREPKDLTAVEYLKQLEEKRQHLGRRRPVDDN